VASGVLPWQLIRLLSSASLRRWRPVTSHAGSAGCTHAAAGERAGPGRLSLAGGSSSCSSGGGGGPPGDVAGGHQAPLLPQDRHGSRLEDAAGIGHSLRARPQPGLPAALRWLRRQGLQGGGRLTGCQRRSSPLRDREGPDVAVQGGRPERLGFGRGTAGGMHAPSTLAALTAHWARRGRAGRRDPSMRPSHRGLSPCPRARAWRAPPRACGPGRCGAARPIRTAARARGGRRGRAHRIPTPWRPATRRPAAPFAQRPRS
jgi:hypothetical protein